LIAQLVLVLVQQLVQARLLVQELQQVQVLVQELQQVQVQVLVQESVLGLQQVLASELVQHLPHQQLQSRCQLQRSRLLRHEFLSTLQQLAKVLLYQLCL
jgi:hypothetical protein